jgi:hypothetical protein
VGCVHLCELDHHSSSQVALKRLKHFCNKVITFPNVVINVYLRRFMDTYLRTGYHNIRRVILILSPEEGGCRGCRPKRKVMGDEPH